MGPVAAAARQNGMVYGLWYEFERVVAGTSLAKRRPEWLLKCADPASKTYLLNLGLPEVRQHLFDIVKGFMDLPGFRFYRSDFNMDPLSYWQENDAADRQGVTEMKYVEGLYEFWDRLATAWPDAFHEECASGGRRIDLETVMRMHLHQESDYWFDNEVDLARAWSLSRYLPNSTFTTPLTRLDDRSFHSTMATSLIPAWIADAPGFDRAAPSSFWTPTSACGICWSAGTIRSRPTPATASTGWPCSLTGRTWAKGWCWSCRRGIRPILPSS